MLMKLKKLYIFGTWLKFNLTWWRSSIYPEAINSEEQKGVFAELLKSTFLLCILVAILLGKGEKLSHQHMLLLAYRGLKAFLTGPHTARCLRSIARQEVIHHCVVSPFIPCQVSPSFCFTEVNWC